MSAFRGLEGKSIQKGALTSLTLCDPYRSFADHGVQLTSNLGHE